MQLKIIKKVCADKSTITMLQVHNYEPLLREHGPKIQQYLATRNKNTITDAFRLIYEHNPPAAVLPMLTLLQQDHGNVDPVSSIHCWDLLCLLTAQELDWDILWEQLTDMIHGSCPQGRVYRLLQLIWP